MSDTALPIYDQAFTEGRLVEAMAFLERIRHLPHKERKRAMIEKERELQAKIDASREMAAQAERKQLDLATMLDEQGVITALMEQWGAGRYTLSRLEHSMMHKVLEAAAQERIVYGVCGDDILECERDFPLRLKKCIPFVIEHDWAGAFANATDFSEGDYRLPFEDTVFEMRANGRHCAFVCSEDGLSLFLVQVGNGWFAKHTEETPAWVPALVRAACIALDAEVASFDAVRAPEKLNAKRVGRGKLPMLDYHVIKLAKRSRVSPLPLDAQTRIGRHPRLHFVRGHWRHYESHKTWVKWHLRGDPDLGFIDKHYRL